MDNDVCTGSRHVISGEENKIKFTENSYPFRLQPLTTMSLEAITELVRLLDIRVNITQMTDMDIELAQHFYLENK